MSNTGNLMTREIPKDEWLTFCDDFSKRHRGWMVTVEETGADIGDQEEATLLPFVGISADVKAGEDRIAMILGGKKDRDVNRIINKPTHVWFKHSSTEQYDVLDVEAEDGTKTLLQFRFIPAQQTGGQLPEP